MPLFIISLASLENKIICVVTLCIVKYVRSTVMLVITARSVHIGVAGICADGLSSYV